MDTLGQTALHRAALAGHIQTCKLLLSYGADPSIVSLQGFTAAQMGNEAVQQILNGTDCLTWSGFRFDGCTQRFLVRSESTGAFRQFKGRLSNELSL